MEVQQCCKGNDTGVQSAAKAEDQTGVSWTDARLAGATWRSAIAAVPLGVRGV